MSHQHSAKTSENKPPAFPKSLYLVMVLALGLMLAYNQYWAKPTPQQLVTGFWTAYFNKDYPTVVHDLSVSFLVQTSPEHMTLSHSELLKVRPQLEATAQPLIQRMRESYQDPANPKIIILDKYTQMGNLGGVVFFEVMDGDQLLSTQSALLIYEDGELKILDFGVADEQWLSETSDEEMKQMFSDYETLLQQLIEG